MNKIMKSAIIFKQMFIAMAALTMVGCLSSCRDQDFDWDTAHANTSQEKFDNAFINEFGKPAPNHTWGFDCSWGSSKAGTRADGGTPDGHIYKMAFENMTIMAPYAINVISTDATTADKAIELVPNIKENENWEVYEWFSTHRVVWENTIRRIGTYDTNKTYYDGSTYTYSVTANEDISYWDGENKTIHKGETFTHETISQMPDGHILTGTLTKHKTDGTTETFNGNFVVNTGAQNGDIVFCPMFTDAEHRTRVLGNGSKAIKVAELSSNNSLKNYTPEYWLNTPYVGLEIDFQYAFIQHVASTATFATARVTEGDTNHTPYQFQGDSDNPKDVEICFDGSKEMNETTTTMDQLHIYESVGNSGYFHTLDWNAHQGYGYGDQKASQFKYPTSTSLEYYFSCNATFVKGQNLNNIVYQNSSNSSSKIDKWIIVYLKGDGYEGWYLGFDIEAFGAHPNEQYAANGYCNDWIVKLTSVDAGSNKYSARIFCEDLGAVYQKNSSDIDYNDLVLDIDFVKSYKGMKGPSTDSDLQSALNAISNRADLTITPMAAGGTLPLVVGYGTMTTTSTSQTLSYKKRLFEVHEYINDNLTFYDNDHIQGELSYYQNMLNTNAPDNDVPSSSETLIKEDHTQLKGNGANVKSALPYKLQLLDGSSALNDASFRYVNSNNVIVDAIIPQDVKTLLKNYITVEVYRFSGEDYVGTSGSSSVDSEDAAWFLLDNDNSTTGVPVKICVPQEVNWLRERHQIGWGYPKFSEWVEDPTKDIWSNKVSRHLHNE